MCHRRNAAVLKISLHIMQRPSLLGIKCANLISLENDEFNILGQIERFNEIARRQETEDQAYVPM